MAKNKTIIALLFTVLCIMLIANVSALSTSSLSGTVMQGETFEGTITITNNEAVNITSISLSEEVLTSGSETISTGDISISPSSVTQLNVGESVDISYTVDVDHSEEAGTYTGNLAISYNNGSTQSATADIALSVVDNPNKLLIKDVDIKIDGKKKNVDQGDEFNVQPGDEVEITVEVENLYTSDDDIRLEDVEVCVENDDLDWDECEDLGDIKDGDEESITFTFVVDYDVDSDDSPFRIDVEAVSDDEDNKEHEDALDFDLDLDKERDEVIITDLYLSPSVVGCNEANTRLNIELINSGRDDQSNAVLEITADELGFEEYIRGIDLDEGDRDDFDVVIPLNNVKSGEVFVEIRAYATSDKDDLTSVESITFLVTCEDNDEEDVVVPEEDEEEDDDSNMEIVVPVVPTTSPAVHTSVGQKKSFINSNDGLYIGLLILIALLLIVLIFVLAVNFAHKKK